MLGEPSHSLFIFSTSVNSPDETYPIISSGDYSGEKGNYAEKSPPHAENSYFGKQAPGRDTKESRLLYYSHVSWN